MPNIRKRGLIHIGAWIKEDLNRDLKLIAHLQLRDKTQVIIEALEKQIGRELKKLPAKLRRQLQKALNEGGAKRPRKPRRTGKNEKRP